MGASEAGEYRASIVIIGEICIVLKYIWRNLIKIITNYLFKNIQIRLKFLSGFPVFKTTQIDWRCDSQEIVNQ